MRSTSKLPYLTNNTNSNTNNTKQREEEENPPFLDLISCIWSLVRQLGGVPFSPSFHHNLLKLTAHLGDRQCGVMFCLTGTVSGLWLENFNLGPYSPQSVKAHWSSWCQITTIIQKGEKYHVVSLQWGGARTVRVSRYKLFHYFDGGLPHLPIYVKTGKICNCAVHSSDPCVSSPFLDWKPWRGKYERYLNCEVVKTRITGNTRTSGGGCE